MDLAIGAKRVFVMMSLFAKDGTPKLVPTCTYPLTGVGCVDRVYTDVATFEVHPGGVVVTDTYGMSYAGWRTGSTYPSSAPRGLNRGRPPVQPTMRRLKAGRRNRPCKWTGIADAGAFVPRLVPSATVRSRSPGLRSHGTKTAERGRS